MELMVHLREYSPNLTSLELHRGTGQNSRRENIIVLAAVQHALRDRREVSNEHQSAFMLHPSISFSLPAIEDIRCRAIRVSSVVGGVAGGAGCDGSIHRGGSRSQRALQPPQSRRRGGSSSQHRPASDGRRNGGASQQLGGSCRGHRADRGHCGVCRGIKGVQSIRSSRIGG